ncbi:hypothetical protein [Calothrix sp. 336/3]|uniref:hypothetical protein n=1 Tax=Calothrix sp. 336/3 TaxID=1337936 RepID=UPI0004E2CC33|nr:hypothetical protein [Calothrix sp. 336/3]AKG21981.1 hypothetical protein IJ00_12565 [Calothrix sp. 336/3]
MAGKSRDFRELLLEERASQETQNMITRLKKDIESGELGEFAPKAIVKSPKKEKMSDILAKFVKPYKDTAQTIDDFYSLLTMAVIAWNASLLSEDKQLEMIDSLLADTLDSAPPDVQEEIKELIDELITRKNKYFAHIKRYIIDFKIKDRGRDYSISVVSTVIKEDKEAD